MKVEPIRAALIGSGCISETYLRNMTTRFAILDIVGCSDIIDERSRHRAEQFGIRQMTNEEIYNDPSIQIVVNTTYPTSHYKVTKEALLAGKNVHTEKMLAVTLEEGEELKRIADEKGLKLGCAPDTFLGASYQTARKYLDAGMIGEPFYAQAMVVRGYHPLGTANEFGFVFQPGGGIPFDMGGYYLHALIHMLGPVKTATGFLQERNLDRPVINTKNPKYGEPADIRTPNALTGSLLFESGVTGNIAFMSDGFGETSRLEIYGTEGTLICPDPNCFGNPVFIRNKANDKVYELPMTHGYGDGCCRGLGVADMAWSIRNGRLNRASGEMGLHAFEIVHGIWESTRTGAVHQMHNKCAQPKPLPSGFTSPAEAEHALDN